MAGHILFFATASFQEKEFAIIQRAGELTSIPSKRLNVLSETFRFMDFKRRETDDTVWQRIH
ncbi:MAG: hypothetical protein LIO46_05655 [Clostridiales bacterium]|nr:hypothetical protein [Clostridiales bacterium]